MAGKFQFKKFSDIDIGDPFFDSLKEDYPGNEYSTGFVSWFAKKSAENATALVFDDDDGIGAFVVLKDEYESIELAEETLSATPRKKISTLRLAERYRGQRLGEGALGLALWQWRRAKTEEIYVTVFEKHDHLIALLERFGFRLAGKNPNGELVYLKSRSELDYSDPYKSFPFIDPAFEKAGYLVINDVYHDTLFPYSELSRTLQEAIAMSAANGMSKIYIGSPQKVFPYKIGEPIFIYRRYTGNQGSPGHKSCITSYCVVADMIVAKANNVHNVEIEELLERIGNKSVYSESEIRAKYSNERNLIVVEMLYCGYFGAGNNVNWVWLKNNGCWPDNYPTNARLTQNQFKDIITEGKIDVSDVIVN
jgi:GNAT superfamily N-acetyltransferase